MVLAATRRLTAAGQRPATVGTFFSLGHSTVVIITCVVVAATSGALRDRFAGFQTVGAIIGTAVSAAGELQQVSPSASTWRADIGVDTVTPGFIAWTTAAVCVR